MRKIFFIAAIAFFSCNNSSEGGTMGNDSNLTNVNTTPMTNVSDSTSLPGTSSTTGAGIGAGTDSNLNKAPDTVDRH